MSTEDVPELLRSWGLEELVSIFNAQRIEWEQFLNLNDDVIKELIPVIGTRIKFLQKYGQFQNRTNMPSGMVVLDILHQEPETSGESQSTSGSSSNNDNPLSSIDEYSTLGMTKKQITQTPFMQYMVDCACKTGLEDLLNTSLRGKVIFNSFQVNGNKLTNKYQDKLVDLIIENELGEDGNKKITCEKFEELAHAIVAIFPSENKALYFAKEKRLKNGKAKYIAKGKLFNKFYNLRKLLRVSGVIRKKKATNDSDEFTDDEAPCDDADDVEESILFLKHNITPLDAIKEHWNKTFITRRQILRNLEIHEYFDKFPILKTNEASILYDQDFCRYYPQNNVLYERWNKFAKGITHFARINSTDKLVKSLLQDIASRNNLSEEGTTLRVLKILAYIVTPVSVTKNWKPSRKEIEEGFLMHVKGLEDLQKNIEDRETKLRLYKVRFQPTPIIVGEDLDHITASYIRVNEVLCKVESPLKAVEICFKAIHALNAIYSADGEQVWLIIQKGLFMINTEFDKSFTSVNNILSYMLD